MHESAITALRWRLGCWLFVKHALAGLTLAGFGWGVVVLVSRLLLGETAGWLWWGLAGIPVVMLAALPLAVRRLPSRPALRALVDRASRCGGLLMAGAETPLEEWQERLPDPAHFRIRWQGGKLVSMLAASALFLAATLLFPQSLVSMTSGPELAIGKETERLTAQLEVLKQESILEQDRAQYLKEKLRQIQKEASGKNPVKTLEALDHVRDSIERTAKQAAESALRKTEKLGKAEGLVEGLRKKRKDLDAQVHKEAMRELAALVQKAAHENELLGKHLDSELMRELQGGHELTPEQMKKLAEALKGSKMDLAKMLGKLHAAKLIDAELLEELDKAGQCDCADALVNKGGKMSIAAILAQCQGKTPGKGGVTEGPGTSPIAWNQNTSEKDAKFKEETLPPGALAKLKDSKLLGVGQADPKKDEKVGPSQGGALVGANTGGGSATTATILPRHQATVERFFKRSDK